MIGHEKTEASLREQMAKALEQSEARYRQLVENASDIIFRADEGGYFTFVNPAALRLTGYPENEILGKHYTELIRQDHRETAMKFFGRQYVKKIPTTYHEFPLVAKNGVTVWIGQNTQLIMDKETIVGFQSISRDITDRKLAQDTLQESEGRLQGLVEHIPQRIFIKDRNSVYLYCNKQYASDHGITPDQIKGKDDFEFYTPEMALAYRADDEACMATGTARETEKPYQCNGQELWIHTIKVPYRDGQGQIIGVLGLFEDITNRKRMELTLRDSESRLRTLAETMPDALVVYDDLGRVTFANNAFEELYGWSTKELVGKTITNFVPPSEKEITRHNWESTIRGETVVFETKRWTKECKVIDVQISTSRLQKSNGKYTGGVVVHHDITARKREHEKLQNNEYMLKTILATSPVGIGLVLDRKIKWVNDACLKMFGFEDQEEIAGQSTRIFYPSDEEYECAGLELYTDMQSGKISEIVASFGRKDGSIFDARIRIRSVDPSSSENLIIFVITDISDQLRAEQDKLDLQTQLVQSQKLEALGTLAGGIAHDFNNQLAVVLGNLELALMDRALDPKTRQKIANAITAAKSSAESSRQMQIYAGNTLRFPVDLDLNELAHKNQDILKSAVSKTTTLHFEIDEGLPLIRGDADQIQLIITSLVMNASEAIGANTGDVTIKTGVMDCDEAYLSLSRLEEKPAPGELVFLEVADNGCGMDAETQHRLFDPFFTTKFRGRGLGMAEVMGLVKGHRGAIIVDSQAGKGTTIRVLFPVATQELEPSVKDITMTEPRSTISENLMRSKTILVVDDEQSVRELCVEWLDLLGYNTIAAVDGAEGVGIFRERLNEIDMVLLDYVMPRMNGIEALDELIRIKPDVKVIFSSGYNEDIMRERFPGPRPASILHKPYDMDILKAELDRLLGTTGSG